jgi:MtN3 and saliva related transmembrane protein
MELAIFGYIAAFCTAVSFLPQAVKTIRTKDTNGLSLLTYLFLFFGSLSWFIYGIVLSDVPLMGTNFLTTIFTGIILFLILRGRN